MREAQALFGLRVKDMARGHAAGKLDDLQPRQIACVLSCATPALPACDLLDLGGELDPWMKQGSGNMQSPYPYIVNFRFSCAWRLCVLACAQRASNDKVLHVASPWHDV